MSPVKTAAQILADIRASGIPDDDMPRPVEQSDRQIGTHMAAVILGVTPDTVRRMAAMNVLPSSRLGAHLKFWESDVRMFRNRVSRLPPVAGTAALPAGER